MKRQHGSIDFSKFSMVDSFQSHCAGILALCCLRLPTVWTRRVERVGRFSQISSPRQVNTSMSCYKESLYGQKIPQISPNGAVSHQMHSELCSALDSVRKSGQKERSLALKQKVRQMHGAETLVQLLQAAF